jgi:Flp pilus assembly protein TadG
MRSRLRHLRHDERGMTLVFVGMGFLALFAATTLAIDVGLFMTARAQAQTSADAGALSGATALVLDDWDNRGPAGPAVQSAIGAATANVVIDGDVSVVPADVTFPLSPSGESSRVRVEVFRTAARNNPLATLIGPLYGVPFVDISAMATAEASPANAMTCVKPFIIPDRWVERQGNSTFDRYDNKGNVIDNPDIYIRPGEPGYNGYHPTRDRGLQLTLRAGTGDNVEPTMYYSWKMPEDIGGDYYRDNIRTCNTRSVGFDTVVQQEPGNMVGPTNQGIDELIAQDPGAYWDTTTNSVVSPFGSRSPRVFPIPLYDPDFYQGGVTTGRNATLRVANWIGFFVEGRKGNEVFGRVTPVLGTYDPNAGPAPDGAFPRVIRLVE